MSHDALVAALNVLAASSSSKSSSGSPVLLIFLVLLFGVYFFWLRPQRAKMRAQQSQRQAPEVGDEVITSAGIMGRVVGLDDDRARVEVSPGQVLTIHRSALGRRVEPPVPESADDLYELNSLGGLDVHDHDAHDAHDHDHDHDHGAHNHPDDGDASGPPGQWWPAPGEEGPPGEPEGSS